MLLGPMQSGASKSASPHRYFKPEPPSHFELIFENDFGRNGIEIATFCKKLKLIIFVQINKTNNIIYSRC